MHAVSSVGVARFAMQAILHRLAFSRIDFVEFREDVGRKVLPLQQSLQT